MMSLASTIRALLMFVPLLLLSAENLRGAEVDEAITLDGSRYASRQEFHSTGGRCRTADLSEEERASREAMLIAIPEAMLNNNQKIVRVFLHVITSSSGFGNLPGSAIDAQMAVLNKAVKGSSIQFELTATKVTANDNWHKAKMNSDAEKQMKKALRRGRYNDLNLYTTAQSDNTLGWATFPGNVGSVFDQDGVVVDFRTFPGGSFAPYNLGQTVSHEVGHWLGLQHTFNGGCASSTTAGDQVAETPAEASPNVGCPASRNTCPGNSGAMAGDDPIHNYMDYSDDRCMDNLTSGQKTRIKKQWALYRA
eukprot:gene13576-15622_t